MLFARYIKYPLLFLFPAGTSRGVLKQKDSWFLIVSEDKEEQMMGVGEVSIIPGLSPDNPGKIEAKLDQLVHILNAGDSPEDSFFDQFPAIRFGYETAMLDLRQGGKRILFPSVFTSGNAGISINGLIWMGPREDMLRQVDDKYQKGYRILKLKVGALDFEEEVSMLKELRKKYKDENLEIRIDANGAWDGGEALVKLERLSEFRIHSVEQPVKAGNLAAMSRVCSHSPIPVALDEELIGVEDDRIRKEILTFINPSYVILKPSLLGGFAASSKWMDLAKDMGIDWWVTSALEANIGLNAISQYCASLDPIIPQGLGTGKLFSNNISSPLQIIKDKIWYKSDNVWDLSILQK